MRKSLLVALLALAALPALAEKTKAAAKPEPKAEAMMKDPEVLNLADAQWAQPFGPTGPNIGLVQGKFGDGNPTSFFVKFAAGSASPWHIHSNDYEGVVLKGTFTEQETATGAVRQLPPGTYFLQTSKVPHQNSCLKGEDCVVFVHFDKGADSIMTTPEGKALPPKEAAK